MSIARLTALSLSACAALLACEGTKLSHDGSQPSAERSAEQTVVYGDDDRTDYYAVADPALQTLLDQSIVALVLRDDIDVTAFDDDPAGTAIPLGNMLGNSRGLCSDERFLDDPTMGNCSGTLIDDNLVLTAGHCVEDLGECRSQLYVFDYYFEADGDLQEIDPDDVYECESVVVTIDAGTLDYAIVELDRPVVGRTPANVNLVDVALPADSDLTVIGFGSGIPAKVDEGGVVTDGRPDSLDYFEATLDTFGGNSGSGVFNDARELVGILVRGATDYSFDDDAGCNRVRVLAEDSGTAEDVTYVRRAIDDLCNNANWPSARLCGASATCGDGVTDEGEECDDNNLDSGDGCSAICSTEFCGDAVIQPGLDEFCDDGNDISNDGCSNTCVVECGNGDIEGDEACDDGNVEDGDGCSATCRQELCPLNDFSLLVGTTTIGDTCDGADVDGVASCGDGTSGGDDGYLFIAPRDGMYSFDTLSESTEFDTVLYARTACGADELACNDDSDLPGADEESSFSLTLDSGDEIVVYVSGFRTNCGDYGLNVSVSPCGDGETTDGEQCDDGNLDSDDGCSALCLLEEPDSCVTEDTVLVLNSPVVLDSCDGENSDNGATCGDDTATSLERSFAFLAPQAGTYRFDTLGDATDMDTVIYSRSECLGDELDCNDDVDDDDTRSLLSLDLNDGEAVIVFVHGFQNNCGVFELLATTDECGNSRLEADEQCDDGNVDDGDGCDADCVFEDVPRCGDGTVDEGEACDDGNDVEFDGCNALCAFDGCLLTATLDFAIGSFVGDSCEFGFEDAPNCGDGEDGAAFPIAFTAPTAGTYTFTTDSDLTDFDTVLTLSESCGGSQIDCNDDTVGRRSELQATLIDNQTVFLAVSGYEGDCGDFELLVTVPGPECGDGVTEGDEDCDDGDENSDITPGACRTDCSAPFCGDGVVDPDEACDEGPANEATADACRPGCELPRCGDSIVDTGEMCDAGETNGNSPDGCRTTCMPAGCGDGVVDSGEACDEGLFNNDEVGDACRTSCTLPSCGDGVIDADEECDDADDNSDEFSDACRADCLLPFCGDAVVDVGEACDEGEANSDDPSATCSFECAAPSCGDGVINGEEECDEGAENADESDSCRTMCTLPYCGDSILDSDEECDAGADNDDLPDVCRLDCRVPACGDSIVDGAEECDDGTDNNDEPGACGLDCAIVPFGPDVEEDAGGDADSDATPDGVTDDVQTDTPTPDAEDGTTDDTGQDDGGEDAESDIMVPDADSAGADTGEADNPEGGVENGDEDSGGSESGCSASAGTLPSLWFVLVSLGMVLRTRRQRVA
ncbi:MAG: cysteine-rich repeat protein [Bradymonadia bacterium]|jgi:cysteine-rich repeat protein